MALKFVSNKGFRKVALSRQDGRPLIVERGQTVESVDLAEITPARMEALAALGVTVADIPENGADIPEVSEPAPTPTKKAAAAPKAASKAVAAKDAEPAKEPVEPAKAPEGKDEGGPAPWQKGLV